MDKPVVRDATLLLVRLIVGVVFIAHSWDRFAITGLKDTAAAFGTAGVPQPRIAAWLVGLVEGLGGAMLVAGILSTFAAGVLFIVAGLALYFVHLGQGFLVTSHAIGWEYPLVVMGILLIIVVFGPGRASIDGVLVRADL